MTYFSGVPPVFLPVETAWKYWQAQSALTQANREKARQRAAEYEAARSARIAAYEEQFLPTAAPTGSKNGVGIAATAALAIAAAALLS